MSSEDSDLSILEERIGYQFKKRSYLEVAITHTSLPIDQYSDYIHNQRLEYLGDAILSMILAEYLFCNMPEEREGFLTHSRAALANGNFLAELARDLSIPEFLRMSEAARKAGSQNLDSVLEDALEALIAAIYLDSDLTTTSSIVLSWYGEDIQDKLEKLLRSHNPKGRLQEHIQQKPGSHEISYETVKETGPSHSKTFIVELSINEEVVGTGEGPSKKDAEEKAAVDAIEKLGI